MRRNPAFYFLAALMAWGPALSRPLAAAIPTASMFKGRVTEESATRDKNVSPEQLLLADQLRAAGVLDIRFNTGSPV